MPRHNWDADREYLDLMRAIEDYAEENSDVVDAVADALEDYFEPSEWTESSSTCIGRLTDGGNCSHGGGQRSSDKPHKPPHADHPELWLKDGEPVAYTMHLYNLTGGRMLDIYEFAEEHELSVRVRPASWYYVNRTICVEFRRG